MASNVSIPAGAMAAALAAAGKHDPNEGDPSAGGSPQGSPQDPTGGAQTQTDPTQGGQAAQGQDPNQQAVWSEFPSTDPQAAQALAQQMQSAAGDPQALVDLFGQFVQQGKADQDKLSQMQEAMLAQFMDLISGPGGDQGQPAGPSPVPSQGPGVGGAGSGY